MIGKLEAWERFDNGDWIRNMRDEYGAWIISFVDGRGWSASNGRGAYATARPTGPETGDAGKAAADKAALEMGWTLEGGPFIDMSARDTLSPWKRDGDMTLRTRGAMAGPDIAVSVVYDGKGWMVDKLHETGTVTGPEHGRAGQAAADRAAMAMGWTLAGGPSAPPVDVSALQDEVARLTAEIVERTRERDYWASEAQRLLDASLEVERLRSVASRVADLERAIVAMALRMGER